MTLSEFFDRYGASKNKRADYTRQLSNYPAEVVMRVCDRMSALCDNLPSLGRMSRECDVIERATRSGIDETRRRLGPMLDRRRNTPDELALFALIRAMNRRGVLWDFVRGCWVAPDDPDYAATRDFDYGPCERCDPQEPIVSNGRTLPPPYRGPGPCGHCGPEPTLDGTRAKWRALFHEEPFPPPFASPLEALSSVARGSGMTHIGDVIPDVLGELKGWVR